MSECCCDDTCRALQGRQKGTLWSVLGINAVMFVVVAAAALYGRSSALLTDSLDDLGDALTYGLSLYAVSRGRSAKAKVALVKGALIFLGAAGVAVQLVVKLALRPSLPLFEVMGAFSLLSLTANLVCLYLLWRHRGEDVNMSSVWECSRNDIVTNLAVFAAAGAVRLTGSAWPDVVVAACLVAFLMRSSLRVAKAAAGELRAARAEQRGARA